MYIECQLDAVAEDSSSERKRRRRGEEQEREVGGESAVVPRREFHGKKRRGDVVAETENGAGLAPIRQASSGEKLIERRTPAAEADEVAPERNDSEVPRRCSGAHVAGIHCGGSHRGCAPAVLQGSATPDFILQ